MSFHIVGNRMNVFTVISQLLPLGLNQQFLSTLNLKIPVFWKV